MKALIKLNYCLLAPLAALLLFTGCGAFNDGNGSSSAGKSGGDLCSVSNPAGKCAESNETCVNGVCVLVDNNESDNGSVENDTEGVVDKGGDNNPQDDGLNFKIYGNIKTFDYLTKILNWRQVTISKQLQKIIEASTVKTETSDEPVKYTEPTDVEVAEAKECNITEIAKEGPHSQCLLDTPFGFNYTSSPSPNYGVCELQYTGKPMSQKQYIYKGDKGELTRHDVLYECILRMSCYEGIFGLMDPLIEAAKDPEFTADDININIKLYLNNEWVEEINAGNLTNAVKILDDVNHENISEETCLHTLQHIEKFIKFLKDNC